MSDPIAHAFKDAAEEKLRRRGWLPDVDEEEVRAAVNEQIRQQFGHHQLIPAADGGCQRCPLGPGDRIHTGAWS